jgi:hypothetical protein
MLGGAIDDNALARSCNVHGGIEADARRRICRQLMFVGDLRDVLRVEGVGKAFPHSIQCAEQVVLKGAWRNAFPQWPATFPRFVRWK